jgi:hypothetical protein
MKETRKLVTPGMALKWLRGNTINRKIRPSWVAEIAEDIVNGRWIENPAPIIFRPDGSILDGQHRLLAIVKANTPVYLTIVTDIKNPDDLLCVIDKVKRRSTADNMKLVNSRSISSSECAVARSVLKYGTRSKNIDDADINVLFTSYAEELDMASAAVCHRFSRPTLSTVVAVAVRALINGQAKPVVVSFLQAARTNSPDPVPGGYDHNIPLLLNNWIMGLASVGGPEPSNMITGTTERMLEKYLKKGTARVIRSTPATGIWQVKWERREKQLELGGMS